MRYPLLVTAACLAGFGCTSGSAGSSDTGTLPGTDGGTPAADGGAHPDAMPGADATPGADAMPGADAAPAPDATNPDASSALGTPHVHEHHGGPTRNGQYLAPTFSRMMAAGLVHDTSFNAAISIANDGAVYAQPLYLENVPPNGRDLLIVATERNNVIAFDAADGSVVWRKNVGDPVSLGDLPCGNISPLGITGTPVYDPAGGFIYLDAMTTPDGGATKKHMIFALSVQTGDFRPNWQVDVSAAIPGLDSAPTGSRGAATILNDTLYVPFGGVYGDCGNYHGWLVGVPLASSANVTAWSTRATGGGVWAASGVAHDGTHLFVATGNTFGASGGAWGDGEAIIRFSAGPTTTMQPADYFRAVDWGPLDDSDTDIGGTGPTIIDIPGQAEPSHLVTALGKNGKAYLFDRTNMGGEGPGLANSQVSSSAIITAASSYTTDQGTYLVFNGSGRMCPAGQSGSLVALKITGGVNPSIMVAWCANQHGRGSPIVTTIDGTTQSVVWAVGGEGDNRLRGFNGDTGVVIFNGGGAGEAMTTVQKFQSPIFAKGRIFVAAASQNDGHLFAFKLP